MKLNRRFGRKISIQFPTLNMEATCCSQRLLNFMELHGVISQKLEYFIAFPAQSSLPTHFEHSSPFNLWCPELVKGSSSQ
jgi:hypothetical protein